jgi:hypothetical protein
VDAFQQWENICSVNRSSRAHARARAFLLEDV